jgi:hypothetical protein
VDFVTGPSLSTLDVGCELTTQLFPRGQGPWGQVHEPRPGQAGQGHREIVGHDDLIPSCNRDRGGVDLQELGGVDAPVVFLWQVGLELAWPNHHSEVRGKCHATTPELGDVGV